MIDDLLNINERRAESRLVIGMELWKAGGNELRSVQLEVRGDLTQPNPLRIWCGSSKDKG